MIEGILLRTPIATRYKPFALILRYWHLCSLDAPTVSISWTLGFAHTRNIDVSHHLLAAQFATVWSIYVVDRLLDGILRSSNNLEARHDFHVRHSFIFKTCLPVSIIAAIVMSKHIPGQLLKAYIFIAICVVIYLFFVHRVRNNIPKELLVGFLFTMAALMPAMVARLDLFWTWILIGGQFAGVAYLNCILIESWGCAHKNHAPQIWLAVVVILVFTLGGLWFDIKMFSIMLSGAFCAVLLLSLHFVRHRLEEVQLRAYADFVMLAPSLTLWL